MATSKFAAQTGAKTDSLRIGRWDEARWLKVPTFWNELELEDETAYEVENILRQQGWSRTPTHLRELD